MAGAGMPDDQDIPHPRAAARLLSLWLMSMASLGDDLHAAVYDDGGDFFMPGRGPSAAEKRLQEENDG